MFLNPIFESNLFLPRQLNQGHNVCEGGIGAGECLPSSQCVGIVYTDQCNSDPSDYTCCLLRRCTVSNGTGYCRDASNQTCDGGAYFPGTSYPWPCPGPNNIQCCVKYANMTNHTATSTSISTTSTASTGSGTATLPISSSPTSTNTNTSESTSASSNSTQPTAQSQSQSQTGTGNGNGLSSSQIGGIVGGVLAAAVLGGLIAFIFWFRRRRRRVAGAEGDAHAHQAGEQLSRRDGGDADADGAAATSTTAGSRSAMHDDEQDHEAMAKVAAMEMAEKDIPMLGGRMRQEMDASGEAVVHELGTEMGGGKVPGGSKLSELPGSMGRVAELPGSEADFKR